ncbi:restriction endonuclease subunit S [Aminicella lysinilytica]|uniref:Type I restriction enzyme S subunit n=1 Tax=Aminicella lysinilytica TaxID=433323 RepID=A0A4R6Q363_9FIRM|nr:restriction endonuclease subunit S [Aminicella lysinilytica]TDP56365.1 type I restriction enzyme S subunit [Aminicella lysinilytica]
METYRLEDCCDILDSQRVPITEADRQEGEYPYYGANGVQDHVAGYIFDDELVLLAEDGGNFGSKTRPIAYRVSGKCWVNNHAHVLKPKKLIDIDFLCYSLMFYNTDGIVNGATRQKLTQASMRQMVIPKYSKERQLKIIKKLNTIQDIIAVREKQIIELDGLIKARFVEMFGNPVNNEKGFVKAAMGDYMTLLTDFSSNGSYKTLDGGVTMYDKYNYAWMVRTTDLESGDRSAIKYIDESAYELLAKSKIYGGEIIMNKIGSAGKIYLMPQIDMPASLGRNAFMFRYDERINVKFLYYLLTSEYGQREIQQYVRGAVTKTITKNDARTVLIIVPPIEMQNEFEAFVNQVDKSKAKIQKSLDETQLLFDSLMQKYFG